MALNKKLQDSEAKEICEKILEARPSVFWHLFTNRMLVESLEKKDVVGSAESAVAIGGEDVNSGTDQIYFVCTSQLGQEPTCVAESEIYQQFDNELPYAQAQQASMFTTYSSLSECQAQCGDSQDGDEDKPKNKFENAVWDYRMLKYCSIPYRLAGDVIKGVPFFPNTEEALRYGLLYNIQGYHAHKEWVGGEIHGPIYMPGKNHNILRFIESTPQLKSVSEKALISAAANLSETPFFKRKVDDGGGVVDPPKPPEPPKPPPPVESVPTQPNKIKKQNLPQSPGYSGGAGSSGGSSGGGY
tara:strand:+ start:606 stop:1505 length:900 start_codon:yes stop_codon:yes gene_type:complete